MVLSIRSLYQNSPRTDVRPSRETLGAAALLSLILACESSPRRTASDQEAAGPSDRQKALVVATVDPLSSPWRASILHIDPESLGVKTLLSGESGDPAFFAAGSQVLLFNRSVDSKNMRQLTLGGAEAMTLVPSPQMVIGGGDVGDPHDALTLDAGAGAEGDRVLLAQYNEGRLTVISKASGRLLETIDADWDLPQGATLRPEALIPAQDGPKRKIWVIHQAMTTEGGVIRANGSQQVFVLEQDGDALRPLDMDPATPRIQWIKIKGSFPLPVRFAKGPGLTLVSLCSRYVAYASSMAGVPCQSAVEEILPDAPTASVLWDLDGSEYFMNGPVTPGPSPDQFYANVDHQIGPHRYEQKVALFDLRTKNAAGVYTFPPESGGFWWSRYDETTGVLYVGDVGRGSVGQISALKPDGSRQTVPLPGVPLSGILVARP